MREEREKEEREGENAPAEKTVTSGPFPSGEGRGEGVSAGGRVQQQANGTAIAKNPSRIPFWALFEAIARRPFTAVARLPGCCVLHYGHLPCYKVHVVSFYCIGQQVRYDTRISAPRSRGFGNSDNIETSLRERGI